ncbi:MAG TPA: PaaI family thioesterase [Nitrososphaerales archaeon]|jgi:acyl-CoA thioesterase|nr:PaaI family thioesterase [Nitrososphaerales archaeon]
MSFRDLVEKAGSFKALFDSAKAGGADLEGQLQQAFENDRIFRYAGFRVVRAESGIVELSFPMSDNVTRWGGMVHGGMIMTAIDNACGLAVMTVNPGKNQVTMEIKVNFLEQLTDGPFHTVGRVLRRGRTAIVAEGEIRDSKGVLCAKGIGTWQVLNSSGP